jgi:2-keto-4-pentenoate hydratase/2-oxohepta-3-ene-1,7-dioic acid hydratase in catechol pathway
MSKLSKSDRILALDMVVTFMCSMDLTVRDIQGYIDAKLFEETMKSSPEEEAWLKTQKLGKEGRK